MAIVLVKQGGTNASKSAGSSIGITVPAGGHAAGSTVAVGVSGGALAQNTTTVTDSRGNTYTNIDETGTTTTARSIIFVSVLTTALQAADTITVTSTTGWGAPGVAAGSAEWSGVTLTEDVASAHSGPTSGTAPNLAITPVSAETLVLANLCVLGPTGDPFNADTDTTGGDSWNQLTVAGTTGGSATSNITGRMTYKITTSAAVQNYNPTLGTTRVHAEGLCSLQAAVAAAPPVELTVAAPRSSFSGAYRAARSVSM